MVGKRECGKGKNEKTIGGSKLDGEGKTVERTRIASRAQVGKQSKGRRMRGVSLSVQASTSRESRSSREKGKSKRWGERESTEIS